MLIITTITDRKNSLNYRKELMPQKEKIINEKGPGQKKSGQNTMEKILCQKSLDVNSCQKPPNEDFENDEVTDDYNLETNFYTNEEVNPKKGANSRQKYIKNKENMYGYWL